MGHIAAISDIEFRVQQLNNHRLYLANMVTGLFNLQAKLDPEEQAAKILEARIKQLQQADKVLELQINRLTSQRDALQEEVPALRKVIEKNIQGSFGLLGR